VFFLILLKPRIRKGIYGTLGDALTWTFSVKEWPEEYRKKKRAGPALPRERRWGRPYV
jgi:hypothetical protein